MAYTNSQILSAVLSKFLQPLVQLYGGGWLSSLPAVKMLENKVKSIGIVSSNWSLTKEAAPLIEGVSGSVITPLLNRQISKLDDAQVPVIAHSIVDSALKNGRLELFEGVVEIDESDLKELKRLLDINLPLAKVDTYIVKDVEDKEVEDAE